MTDWMRALATQHEAAGRKYPGQDLLIVFDIDGTILDMRHMVRHVLVSYDRAHGTDHFYGLEAKDITVHEDHVDRFLVGLPIPAEERQRVLDWYLARRWSSEAVVASHRPFRGVLEVIRWCMLQPLTQVALNSGRPEALREDTLRSLNAMGRAYRVNFESRLLAMNPDVWDRNRAAVKVAALERFREQGYRIFAVVDNEPANIEAMLEADPDDEILFLHADTIFTSKPAATPRTVRGAHYDLTRLISERDLPRRVDLVWHGVNDDANLRQFLASPVRWCELDVRRDPRHRLVCRHDSYEATPWHKDEPVLSLERMLAALDGHDKAVKLDLKEGGELVGRVLETVALFGLSDQQLWFNGSPETLGEEGFRKIAGACPGAVRQCPVDFLGPLIQALPETARSSLDQLRGWGINRFSIGWHNEARQQIFEWLEQWGFEVNLYDAPDLESFLQAALMLPCSLTADFNFPRWHYFGRGCGKQSIHHEYELAPTVSAA
jgi:hypothetical protein